MDLLCRMHSLAHGEVGTEVENTTEPVPHDLHRRGRMGVRIDPATITREVQPEVDEEDPVRRRDLARGGSVGTVNAPLHRPSPVVHEAGSEENDVCASPLCRIDHLLQRALVGVDREVAKGIVDTVLDKNEVGIVEKGIGADAAKSVKDSSVYCREIFQRDLVAEIIGQFRDAFGSRIEETDTSRIEKLAGELSEMSTIQQVRRIARLEAELGKTPEPKASTAPKPIAPVKGAGGGNKDPSQMSDAEFAQWRREQIKARRGY